MKETHQDQPSDETILAQIQHFIGSQPGVDPREVDLSVEEGIVTLDGTVDAVPEKRRAREIAETIPGVRKVIDNLEIRNFVAIGDEELKNEIINHLSRDAYVQSLDTLEIYTQDGEVRVEGTCKTSAEKDSIGDTIWWTPGVRNVEILVHTTDEPDIAADETAFANRRSL